MHCNVDNGDDDINVDNVNDDVNVDDDNGKGTLQRHRLGDGN